MKLKPEIYIFFFFSGFNFTTAQVVCITAMINYKIISLSAVQILACERRPISGCRLSEIGLRSQAIQIYDLSFASLKTVFHRLSNITYFVTPIKHCPSCITLNYKGLTKKIDAQYRLLSYTMTYLLDYIKTIYSASVIT